jgi:hypothetical protein
LLQDQHPCVCRFRLSRIELALVVPLDQQQLFPQLNKVSAPDCIEVELRPAKTKRKAAVTPA